MNEVEWRDIVATSYPEFDVSPEGTVKALLRVVRAAESYRKLYNEVGETNALIDLWEALEALPEHLKERI